MKKKISLIVTICVLIVFAVPVHATKSVDIGTTNYVLNQISKNYSQNLKNAISDLMFDSDYSLFMSDKTTLRSYEANGNVKSWPYSNADSYGTSVVDRGQTVNWKWGGAGCFSYARFFEYSVYGSLGSQNFNKIYLNKYSQTSAEELKQYIHNYVQPGEHLRVDNWHSVVFLCNDADDTGFYIAEYWGGAKKDNSGYYYYSAENDQYNLQFYTYQGFVDAYSGAYCFVYDAYESSAYRNESPQPEQAQTIKRDIVLVLDVSGSMWGSPLTNTKKAAKRFVEQIFSPSQNTTIAHDTKVAIVTYATGVYVVCELTNDQGVLNSAIDSLSATGNTNMYGGLSKAGEILDSGNADKKAIVIMTDGEANNGYYSTARNETTQENDHIYFNKYGAAIYDLAQEYINNRSYTIYSLGFDVGDSGSAYNNIKYISSFNSTNERYFWNITNSNVDDVVFTYQDIAEEITIRKSIIIAIECPVEVSISRAGETLDVSNVATSFGTLLVTPADDGNNYLFTLDDYDDYEIEINGTDDGTMDMKVTYKEGDTEKYHEFKNVIINADTKIQTSATDRRSDFAIYVDENGDGTIDSGYIAKKDETTTSTSNELMQQLSPTEIIDFSRRISVFAFPEGGNYSSAREVVLSSNISDAEIYYTVDGVEPTTSSTLYTGPINVSGTTIIKTIAVKGTDISDIKEEIYVISSHRRHAAPSVTVKFDTNGGDELKNISVQKGQKIGAITIPEKKGFVFDGWYADKELKKAYSADEEVTAETTLYAGWKVDPIRQLTLTIGNKNATVFGEEKANDVAPIIRNGRTMLPIRFIAEALDAEVSWDAENGIVIVTNDDTVITITIGQGIAIVNGEEILLDSPAFIESDRTFLPLRFVSEKLGAEVDWVEETKQVVITKPIAE